MYCEVEPNEPYAIRRIEEFSKSADGNIEARLRCAFRRSDIPQSLLVSLEKRYSQYFTINSNTLRTDFDEYEQLSNINNNKTEEYLPSTSQLDPQEIYRLKHRELFYSRYIEFNVPIDCFRGKVELDLLTPDIHSCHDYLKQNQSRFFYQITYDQNQKLLSVDRSRIRVGNKFQAEIPAVKNKSYQDEYAKLENETLLWNDKKCSLYQTPTTLQSYLNKTLEKFDENWFRSPIVSVSKSHDNILVIKNILIFKICLFKSTLDITDHISKSTASLTI